MKTSEARCPVCSSLAQFWREKSGYEVFRCADGHCRHGFVHPMPSTAQLEDFYSTSADTLENSGSWTMAEDYKKCPEVVKAFYKRARLMRLRKAGLLRSKETRVLDIGCSTGIFLRILKDEGFEHLSGQELSEEQAQYCLQEHQLKVAKSVLEYPPASVDLVTAYAVLEHVPDVGQMMQDISQVLRQGGSLVIDVPNTRSWYQSISRNSWLWLIPPAHLHYFTPQSLTRLLETHSFKVVSRRTLSTSTYLFIVLYHIFLLVGKPMPGTSMASSWVRRRMIWLVEAILRCIFWPLSCVAERRLRHNQLIYIATKV